MPVLVFYYLSYAAATCLGIEGMPQVSLEIVNGKKGKPFFRQGFFMSDLARKAVFSMKIQKKELRNLSGWEYTMPHP